MRGEPLRYFKEVILPYEGDACLPWPFSKGQGYGKLRHERRAQTVSRLVCETVHGEPPTPEHEAAHSCGNRECANKRHLSWKTSAENKADKLAHGTSSRGGKHYLTKLTEQDARKIRRLAGIKKQRELAAQFGVSRSLVSMIQCGGAWNWIDPSPCDIEEE